MVMTNWINTKKFMKLYFNKANLVHSATNIVQLNFILSGSYVKYIYIICPFYGLIWTAEYRYIILYLSFLISW